MPLRKEVEEFAEAPFRAGQQIKLPKKAQQVVDAINSVAELYTSTPGADLTGLTQKQMVKPFIDWLFSSYAKAPQGRTPISQSLRVLAKTPKKVIEDLVSFHVSPEQPTTGFYNRFRSPLWGEGKGAGKVWTEPYPFSNLYYTPDTLAHEFGHGASWRILERLGMAGSPAEARSFYHTIQRGEWEGVAEYLGNRIGKAAGVEKAPVFPYGPVQQQSFEELSQMPSKNPYMNVYRYLQRLMRNP